MLRGISCEERFPCQLERDLACFDTFRGAVFKGHMSLHATAEPKNVFSFGRENLEWVWIWEPHRINAYEEDIISSTF